MALDIQAFCESCAVCQQSKATNHKPYGLLRTLEVPTEPWESIGIDFVGPLPVSETRDGEYDMITSIIDHLTGMVHVVPSRANYTAKDVAELVFSEVYRHHGLPKNIVSDRDSLFTSKFWTHLHQLVGTKLKMSSSYHPETDGATERANRTIGQMLRQCVNETQDNWAVKLPAVEFAINSARSETTGYAPFFLNNGRMPRSLLGNTSGKAEFPGVRKFMENLKIAVIAAHDSILHQRVKQTRDANRRRIPSPFQEDDLVYISTVNMKLSKGKARKLTPKYIGPYKILKVLGETSCKVDLPPNLKKRGLHDVFHPSLLRIHVPNDDRLFPGRLDTQIGLFDGSEMEWPVERILTHKGSRADALFKVLWKSGDSTWLPYERVSHLSQITDYFLLLGITDVSELTKQVAIDGNLEVGLVDFVADSSEENNGYINRVFSIACSQQNHTHTFYSTMTLSDTPASALPKINKSKSKGNAASSSTTPASPKPKETSITTKTASKPILASIGGVTFDAETKEWLFQVDEVELGAEPCRVSLAGLKTFIYTSYAIGAGFQHIAVPEEYFEVANFINSNAPKKAGVMFATYDEDGDIVRGAKPVGLNHFYTPDQLDELGLATHDAKLKANTRNHFPKPEPASPPAQQGSTSLNLLPSSTVAPFYGMDIFSDILATDRGRKTVLHSLVNAAAGYTHIMQRNAAQKREKEERKIAEAYELRKRKEAANRIKAAKNVIAKAKMDVKGKGKAKDAMDTTDG